MRNSLLLAIAVLAALATPRFAAADSVYKKTYMDAGSGAIYARERARIAATRDRDRFRQTTSGCGVQVGVVEQKQGSNNRGDIEINAITTGPVISYCAR